MARIVEFHPTRARTRTTSPRASSPAAPRDTVWRLDPGNKAPAPPPFGIQEVAIRLLDVGLSLLMLLVLGIPLVIVGLLIRLSSPGPMLYVQERVGRGGRRFTMIKFRTMRVDAEAGTGPVWAHKGDARCTWLGSWLRRLSIDELPQLVNVLRGDMSLVGPRPERPHFVREFAQRLPNYSERHQVLPGITGWAQIHGWRGNTSIAQRLECDLYYVEHRSFWLNVKILLMTPLRVLVERNAY